MLTIEREIDLVIDLKSTNAALLQNKDIKGLFQEAIGQDGWEGIFTVKGEDFVIAQISDEWWEGQYGQSTDLTRSGWDFNDDEVEYHATSFGDLSTWQTISRFIEDGYFTVKYEDGNTVRRFKVGSGKAEQL